MTLTILFSAPDDDWNDYREVLPETLRAVGIDATVTREADAATVDYIVYAPNDTLTDFAPFTRTKAVLSLWAGVEKIVTNPSLTQPLCRMVDDGLALGMRDYVVGHVMRAHLGADRYTRATAPHWDKHVPPLHATARWPFWVWASWARPVPRRSPPSDLMFMDGHAAQNPPMPSPR